MKTNNKINRVKVCNYCLECDWRYPIDIQFCPKCRNKMFPIPYPLMEEK
jgi:hypothetical protein